MQSMRDTVGSHFLIVQTLVLINSAWTLKKVHRHHTRRYCSWIEKSMLCRNCASHILPTFSMAVLLLHT